jgi:hypothetical protein
MLTIWWPTAGVIHNFPNSGEAINAEKYCQQTDEMHASYAKKASTGQSKTTNLAYVSQRTPQKLNKLIYKTMPHFALLTRPAAN